MLRILAARCIKLKRLGTTIYRSPRNLRTYAERRRRTGDGRKRDIFEERGAASEEEYFRKETARQLKELREQQARRKAEKKNQVLEDINGVAMENRVQERCNRKKNTSKCSNKCSDKKVTRYEKE
ncbi:uncharacterized protein LOC116852052 [Odontomachus brunneus]|uniref:uncharacterized protein LOC116852052 n=1 Tax=Odontomachus brunneus TaxID=486640 RepID=UPI0013F1C6D4|nr:uncharacterized protein LOC116852052 [Odontomachus brunneus]